jgi:hypothetical protein
MRLVGVLLSIVMSVAVLLVADAQAETDTIVDAMVNKAVRGGINTVTGVVEWPMQTYKGYSNGVGFIDNRAGSTAVGTVLGFFRGIGHAVGRTSYGLLELFGFWAASPQSNNGVGVPLDAEYAWEWGEQYSIFEPSLREGLKPYGRKLVRGVANGFLGIAEVPGQMRTGSAEGNVALGAARGVWFWWSRTVYGFGEAVLFLAPNPDDTRGYPLREEWPWDALQARAGSG